LPLEKGRESSRLKKEKKGKEGNREVDFVFLKKT